MITLSFEQISLIAQLIASTSAKTADFVIQIAEFVLDQVVTGTYLFKFDPYRALT